jgi:hypothetical protein
MKENIVKSIRIDKMDDGTMKICIEPVCNKPEGKDDDSMGWVEPVTASAKNFEEAFEKIKGVLELKASGKEKPRNIIAEFLQG